MQVSPNGQFAVGEEVVAGITLIKITHGPRPGAGATARTVKAMGRRP